MEYGDESLFAIDDHSIGHDPHDLAGDTGIAGGLGAGYDDHHSAPDEPAPPEHPAQPGHPAQTGTHSGGTHSAGTHSAGTHSGGHGDGGSHSGDAGAPQVAPHPHVPAGHLYVDYEGHHYDAGRVEVDRTHDGRADTAVIHSPGQNEYYTDRDGDGQADELTIFAPDGHLISHEQLGSDGHWHQTPYGTPAEHAGHIAVNYNGTRYDAGQATVDSNGDGHADTAIIHSPGQIEYYVDRDGDGRADELTITTPGGHLISHEEVDPKSGRWRETPLTGPLPRGG